MKQILNTYLLAKIINRVTNEIIFYDSSTNFCFIGIMKGGLLFCHQILEYFGDQDLNICVGYLGLSSYKNGTHTQEKIDVTYPLDLSKEDLKGKNVWIIDDIYDSGLTMIKAKSIIKEIGGFSSLKTVVLVRKMNPKVKLWKNESDLPNVVGYEYFDSGFLVGSGMGMGEKYRCLNGVYELEPEEIEWKNKEKN